MDNIVEYTYKDLVKDWLNQAERELTYHMKSKEKTVNLGPLAPTWSEKIEALIEFFGEEKFLKLVKNHALPLDKEIEEIITLNVALKKLKLACIEYGDE